MRSELGDAEHAQGTPHPLPQTGQGLLPAASPSRLSSGTAISPTQIPPAHCGAGELSLVPLNLQNEVQSA